MPVFIKQTLSGSHNGLPITVTSTASGGAKLIHQVQATATNTLELVTLFILNVATSGGQVEPIFEVTNGGSLTHLITSNATAHTGTQGDTGTPSKVVLQNPLSGTDTAIHTWATQGATFIAYGWIDLIATG